MLPFYYKHRGGFFMRHIRHVNQQNLTRFRKNVYRHNDIFIWYNRFVKASLVLHILQEKGCVDI